MQVGFREFPFESLQAWLLENTDVNDVILSNYEASFMMFSISGRKTVLFRRTHASPFIDYDRRSADIIVALSGNNSTRALRILEKYHVKYVYVDKTASIDPLWVPVSYRDYLESNGVPCHVEWVRYDPADPGSVKIEACVAQFSISNLNLYLQPVFRDENRTLFRVYYPDQFEK